METENPTEFQGIVRGKMIELEREPGLPDGQPVVVTVRPQPGEGLRGSFGGWAGDDEHGLAAYLEAARKARKYETRELDS